MKAARCKPLVAQAATISPQSPPSHLNYHHQPSSSHSPTTSTKTIQPHPIGISFNWRRYNEWSRSFIKDPLHNQQFNPMHNLLHNHHVNPLINLLSNHQVNPVYSNHQFNPLINLLHNHQGNRQSNLPHNHQVSPVNDQPHNHQVKPMHNLLHNHQFNPSRNLLYNQRLEEVYCCHSNVLNFMVGGVLP